MSDNEQSRQQHYESSYIGQIGKVCEPIFEPLGLNWKSSVAVISGVAAKEVVVSTIGVLYGDNADEDIDDKTLHQRLVNSGDFTTASALALLIFTLLYFPCIATLAAIASEYGKKWAVASALYSTTIAWVVAFIVYQLAKLV